jgi:SAM-dependent methyltransferase
MSAEFDSYAKSYDDLLKDPIRDRFAQDSMYFHRRKWLLLRQFLSRRAPGGTKDLRWLDIGCGRGELLRFGRDSFRDAVGCDPSRELLADCNDLTVRHQPEMASLPFDDGIFDVLTAACVYHHLDQAARLALTREVHRVMRRGGVFAIFEHNPWNPATRLIVSRTPVDANAELLTARQLRLLMGNAGLTHIRTCYYLYFPERLYRYLAGVEKCLSSIPAGGQYAVFATREDSVAGAVRPERRAEFLSC